jgi:hypothetical protein
LGSAFGPDFAARLVIAALERAILRLSKRLIKILAEIRKLHTTWMKNGHRLAAYGDYALTNGELYTWFP